MSDPEAAFERLFRENYDPVCRYVMRRASAESVQDIVSETFLAAWRRQGELRGDPLPWLLGVARRVTANHSRGDARRVALRDRLSTQGNEFAYTDADGPSRLGEALSRLPDRDREALLLVAWDGLEHRVAARVMGCSAAAFTVRLHRARRKLERALEADEMSTVNINQQARSAP